ncbi:MAG: cupin domain-containing protein [Candidatus Cloacimonetes bacterium]|nr:cupin domain-containing protein [Candidatus Cloacimonadota bacterium]
MSSEYPHSVGEYTVLTKSLEPFQTIERHFHKGRVETCHIISGVGTFTVEKTRIKKGVGDSITFRKNITHMIQNNENEALEWLEVSVVLDHRIAMSSDSHEEQ